MSSWETREVPVLRAVRDLLAGGRDASVGSVGRSLGLGAPAVAESLRVLAEAHPPYVAGQGLLASDGDARVTALTPRAEEALAMADYAERCRASDDPATVRPPAGPLPPGAVQGG